jgi:hypothetical protein
MQKGHSIALSFDTASRDFVRGVEIGRLWETLKTDEEIDEQVLHASNAEMILRVAEATNRSVVGEQLDDCWLAVTFGPVGSFSREIT